jgi:hypothetical protein
MTTDTAETPTVSAPHAPTVETYSGLVGARYGGPAPMPPLETLDGSSFLAFHARIELTRHTRPRSAQPWQTTDHRLVWSYWHLDLLGGYRRLDRRTCHSFGYYPDEPAAIAEDPIAVLGVSRPAAYALAALWRSSHANTDLPGCVCQGQRDLTTSVARQLRRAPRCPLTGYRFGSARLVHVLDPKVIERVRQVGAELEATGQGIPS